MFHWKPEGRYRRTQSMAKAPFWFSAEHRWTVLTPFWLLANNIFLDIDSFRAVPSIICIGHTQYLMYEMLGLKPRDSFGEFDNIFSWSSESAGNHQKSPSDLPAIVWNNYCNAILPNGKLSLCIYGKVFGGTPNIFMFWLYPENWTISERTVNRALIVHTTL